MPRIPEYAVYIFPLALLMFIGWWFFQYLKTPRPDSNRFAWIREGPKSPFELGSRGKMSRKDILPTLAITIVYSIAAFVYLGDTAAPQSFWRADTGGDSVTVDLGEPVIIDTVFYYTGSFHGPDGKTYYKLEFSENGTDYREQPQMLQKHSMTFQWTNAALSAPLQPTRFIRITAASTPLELGELCVIANSNGGRYNVTDKPGLSVYPDSGQALFDEQTLIPVSRTSVNSSYFDEIYHARAAYEINNGIFNYETTHPPLGKEIIALGVKIFGMTPFGWRFMGTLFGVLMLPLLYLLLKQLFNSTVVSVCGTILWAAEFMHFTQTRLATIDTYNVFFVLLMFIFIHRWMTVQDNAPFWKTLVPLFMCGLSFGLGAAAKWSSIYAGFGLVALYVFRLATCRRGFGFIIKTLLASAVFFLIVPACVYLPSYIPYVTSKGLELNIANLWDEAWRNQVSMFNYHSGLVDTHDYAARWYDWLIDRRPICYYFELNESKTVVSQIAAMNSPLIAWGGLIAVVLCCVDVIERKCSRALFILVGYLSVLLPWVLVSRLTFAYHYFPASMFLVIAVCHIFWRMTQWENKKRAFTLIGAFTLTAVALFIMFYPVLSGVPFSYWYTKNILQWMNQWPM